jgi:hypothetical protein
LKKNLAAGQVVQATGVQAGKTVGTDTVQNFPQVEEQTLNECHELNAAQPLQRNTSQAAFILTHQQSTSQIKMGHFFW